MKKLITALLLVALGAASVVKCPDKETHKEAIMKVVSAAISDNLGAKEEDESLLGNILGGLSSLGSKVSEVYVDNILTVENHYVFSTGTIKVGNETKRVSIGALGYVYILDKEELTQLVTGKK